MRTISLILTTALLSLVGLSDTRAQVSIDVSKITCEQFLLFKITDPKNIALWLSGYYNAKRNNTVIDPQAFEQNVQKIRNYCTTNLQTTVMQAVETTLGVTK